MIPCALSVEGVRKVGAPALLAKWENSTLPIYWSYARVVDSILRHRDYPEVPKMINMWHRNAESYRREMGVGGTAERTLLP